MGQGAHNAPYKAFFMLRLVARNLIVFVSAVPDQKASVALHHPFAAVQTFFRDRDVGAVEVVVGEAEGLELQVAFALKSAATRQALAHCLYPISPSGIFLRAAAPASTIFCVIFIVF